MNRKLRNTLILLLPALLMSLSGIMHPCLHSHGTENHHGKVSLHASSGLNLEDHADPICPICSGELLTAGVPASASSEILDPSTDSFRMQDFSLHDTEKHIHDPRAPPFLRAFRI